MAVSGLRLSPLEERHLPQILEIEKVSQSSPWSEGSFRAEIGHEIGIFVVAEGSDGVVGYGSAWLTVDEIHIITIAVSPDHRRQGVGEKIIREMVMQGVDRGGTCATLEVRAGNEAALGLYESLGFERAGLRKGYYPDNKEDAVVMWLYDLSGLTA